MKWIKVLTVGLIGAVLVSALPVSAAAGYKKNKLNIVSEPGKSNEKYVEYYDGETKLTLDDLEWVEGHTGKGVRLNGDGHLLLVNAAQLNLPKCTFTMWIKWDGAEVNGKAANNQHFFTFYRGKTSLLTAYPDAVDKNGNSLGHRLVLAREADKGLDLDFYRQDKKKNPIPWEAGEWHHLALSFDGNYLYYYIDGERICKELFVLNFAQLWFSYLLIGDNVEKHPSLCATIDDVALYDVPLNQTKIRRLMAGIDIHDDTTTTTTTKKPTTTTTTAPPPTTTMPSDDDRHITLDWSSPKLWIPAAVGGSSLVVMLMVLLTRKRSS